MAKLRRASRSFDSVVRDVEDINLVAVSREEDRLDC